MAQQLYEGVELDGEGTQGLITYMRTDSTNISDIALNETRSFIKDRYGDGFLPATPPTYKTRTQSAQEAHEAVRPTSVLRQPKAIKKYLSRDQFRLYQLIWQRFVASQMNPAIYKTLSVEVIGKGNAGNEYLLRASGSQLEFPGFLVVYEEGKDEDQKEDEEGDSAKIPWMISMRIRLSRCRNSILNSISPNRRHASPKPHWCRCWKRTVLAVLPPMHPSSQPFKTGVM